MTKFCSVASPKLVSGEALGKGKGAYASTAISKGEFLAMIGGETMPLSEALTLDDHGRAQCMQVEDDWVLSISDYEETIADWINHSCNPNAGLSGQMVIVAMRDIAVGEEICFDYATCGGSPLDEFECECGATTCRGSVRGDDWKRPELQQRYKGYFSPYLARRIAAL